MANVCSVGAAGGSSGLGEQPAQPPPGAMQPDPHGRRAHTEHQADRPGVGQPLPGDEAQQLPVALGQPGERAGHRLAENHPVGRVGREAWPAGGGQAGGEPGPPSGGSPVIADDIARDRVQPWE